MVKNEATGRYSLSFISEGVIRRIPFERRGTSKHGVDWTLGGVLVEVQQEECEGSAQLYLCTFDEMLIEQINTIGVGKRVRIDWHIECKEYFDNYKTNAVLDDISFLTDGENFMLNKKKGKISELELDSRP